MKKSIASVVLTVSLVIGQGLPAHAALKSRRFETPSGNIRCHLQGSGALRCDVGSGLKPEPKKECELDWTGLLLSRRHRARPNCAGDTVPSTKKVLDYGEKWTRAGRVCVSKRSGLHCWNRNDYHFKVSRDSWRRWHAA